jgi:hypothetical protein
LTHGIGLGIATINGNGFLPGHLAEPPFSRLMIPTLRRSGTKEELCAQRSPMFWETSTGPGSFGLGTTMPGP